MSDFCHGNIVRYAGHPAALARLTYPCKGGWQADHCLGGTIFLSEASPYPFHLANGEECAYFDLIMAESHKSLGAMHLPASRQPVDEAGAAARERDMLAQAIAHAAMKAGIVHGAACLSGPMLLMLCEDLATAARAGAGIPLEGAALRKRFDAWCEREKAAGCVSDMLRGWLAHAAECGAGVSSQWRPSTRKEVLEFLQEWINSALGGEEADVDEDFASALGDLMRLIEATAGDVQGAGHEG